jgi:uncharacterized protein YqgC (DUF456 family)
MGAAELIESIAIAVTIVAMMASLVLIIVPVVPVTALVWAIGMLFAVLTGFARVTLLGATIMTAFMVLGATSGYWMPFFGLRGRQISWLGLLGFFAGLILGAMFIPIPLINGIIGGVLGVLLVEYVRGREWGPALASGGTALRMTIYGMIAELGFALAVIAVFVISIAATQG